MVYSWLRIVMMSFYIGGPNLGISCYETTVVLGGVVFLPLDPRFAGLNPADAMDF
jgi:hypothetical protein